MVDKVLGIRCPPSGSIIILSQSSRIICFFGRFVVIFRGKTDVAFHCLYVAIKKYDGMKPKQIDIHTLCHPTNANICGCNKSF